MRYRGRFAPSPTGPLHAGSLVAALASWLDARAHGGVWLLRIEDVDGPRCVAGAEEEILRQLSACGLTPDETPWRQSTRGEAYAAALAELVLAGQAYACACTRKEIDAFWAARGVPPAPEAERAYPGTCRGGLKGRAPRAVRFRVGGNVRWQDRRLGPQCQDVAEAVGDFVLKRADGPWAYQLAVVVDDAAQGITHVVRGEDLAANTPRQILLQRALHGAAALGQRGPITPAYLHTPLVLAEDGHKLSKQNGAQAIDGARPLAALQAAGRVLGLPELSSPGVSDWLGSAVPAWAGIIAAFAQRTYQT